MNTFWFATFSICELNQHLFGETIQVTNKAVINAFGSGRMRYAESGIELKCKTCSEFWPLSETCYQACYTRHGSLMARNVCRACDLERKNQHKELNALV